MTLKIDFSGVDRKLAQVIKELDGEGQRAIKETAEQAIKTIVQRTRAKGLDKDGNPFKPYSESYKQTRKRAGAGSRVILTSAGTTIGGKSRKKKRKSLRGNAQGGTMLNSITIVRIEDNGLKIVISLARKKELKKMERHIEGAGSLPVRNPMGFTDKEGDILAKRASRQITAAIQKAGRR